MATLRIAPADLTASSTSRQAAIEELSRLLAEEAAAIGGGKTDQLNELVRRKQALVKQLEQGSERFPLSATERQQLLLLREQNQRNGALLHLTQNWVGWTLRRLGRAERDFTYGGKGLTKSPKLLQRNLAMA